jgi:hypothetical protein
MWQMSQEENWPCVSPWLPLSCGILTPKHFQTSFVVGVAFRHSWLRAWFFSSLSLKFCPQMSGLDFHAIKLKIWHHFEEEICHMFDIVTFSNRIFLVSTSGLQILLCLSWSVSSLLHALPHPFNSHSVNRYVSDLGNKSAIPFYGKHGLQKSPLASLCCIWVSRPKQCHRDQTCKCSVEARC